MFVAYKLLDGSTKTLSEQSLIRIRPTIFEYEPSSAVMVQADTQQSYSSEDFDELVSRFANALPMAKLTMLDETPVFVSVNRVFEVIPPNAVTHNPKAKAIVQFGTSNGSGPLEGVFTSVLESVDEVQEKLNNAYS